MFTKEELEKFEAAIAKAKREHEFKFPITVKGIGFEVAPPIASKTWRRDSQPGQTVAVRSCKDGHGDKTRLGILIGFVPIHTAVRFVREEGQEDVGKLVFEHSGDNPAIFIPELNEVVLGCESWWGAIKDETELREITNDDIQNIWYVKAMKELSEARKAKAASDGAQGGGDA